MWPLMAGGLLVQVNYSEINELVVTGSGHLGKVAAWYRWPHEQGPLYIDRAAYVPALIRGMWSYVECRDLGETYLCMSLT